MVIAGQAILKGQKGLLTSRQKNVQCNDFSGSTCGEIDYYLNPIV